MLPEIPVSSRTDFKQQMRICSNYYTCLVLLKWICLGIEVMLFAPRCKDVLTDRVDLLEGIFML